MSKHLFALGVLLQPGMPVNSGVSDLVSQATPFAVSCETSSRPCSLATHASLVRPSLARCQANAVEFANKVWFLLLGGSEVLIAHLTLGTKGKLCNV